MHSISSIDELQTLLKSWRKSGKRIALVPTMGNLHAGHLSLVKSANTQADRVIVSIFVNPTQFGPGEDFESYPRTLTEDQQQLAQNSVDLLFLPDCASLYDPDAGTKITVSSLSEKLCGAFRPGHFGGVATIVAKLFNLIQPELAFFGEKDFQQLMVIRKMVRDLNFPVTVQSVATAREPDGLAMSSRNGFLTNIERTIAPLLYQTLCAAKQRIHAGDTHYRELEVLYLQQLQLAGFKPDYFAICNTYDLSPAKPEDTDLVILTAAKLGKPRLIDNISFSLTTI